ncbi:MAG: formimidoylglutamate deiminase [Phycisphaera sp. TMED9]|nr:MAG: formimidoylglutamate deiminase [Phycisphaera sp. TMED9]
MNDGLSASEAPASRTLIRPAFLWSDGGFKPDHEIVISGDRIAEIRPATGPSDWAVALLPGFVNAHSHAFQRGMRGLGETFLEGQGSFFTWRASMYELVASLDVERAYRTSRLAFEEMLDAGITTVGEFHYIHHADDEDEAARWMLDDAVLRAARDAGIRIVLLHCDYVRGGFDDRPLDGGQLRFDTRGLEHYLASLDRVEKIAEGPLQSVAAVSHSTRAVPIDRIAAVHAEATRRGTAFHLHLEEVVQEIDDCQASHGRTPMRLALEHGVIDQRTTAVHCTHSTPEDLRDFAAAGARICLCPNTEGNLGDGICDLATMRDAGIPIAIGTDLNSRIAPAEDLRWIEYVQRVRHQMRGAVTDGAGRSGGALLDIATVNGAASLGVESGSISLGRLADFVAIDLDHRTLQGVDPDHLADAIVMGTGPECLAGTCVGGTWVRGGPDAARGGG